MIVYDPMDCQDSDAPLGHPCCHQPDESTGALVWLGVALIVAGMIAWWSLA